MTIKSERRWKRFNPNDKLRVFLVGVHFAVLNDRNLAIQMVLSVTVLVLTFALRAWFDFVLILAVTGHMLVVEMVNTAIEALCDFVQPEYDPRIGAVKDVAAAASGIAILMWLMTIIYEGTRIWSLL